MAVSLELLGRGPARPDLLEDLVFAEPDLAAAASRWSVPSPILLPGSTFVPGADVSTQTQTQGQGPEEGADSVATGLPDPDAVQEALAAGTPVWFDAAPAFASDASLAAEQVFRELAELVVIAAHAGVGFGTGLIPRCTEISQVFSLLSCAVAAMTGGDVVAALRNANPAALLALPRSAREAIRDVITFVVVPPDRATALLAAVYDAES